MRITQIHFQLHPISQKVLVPVCGMNDTTDIPDEDDVPAVEDVTTLAPDVSRIVCDGVFLNLNAAIPSTYPVRGTPPVPIPPDELTADQLQGVNLYSLLRAHTCLMTNPNKGLYSMFPLAARLRDPRRQSQQEDRSGTLL